MGGGYKEQSLSDIPLIWMTEKAIKHGLSLYPSHKVQISEDADGFMHDSRGTSITKWFRRKLRTWDFSQQGKPIVHQSVLDRNENQGNHHSPYHPWILDLEYEVEPWVRYKNQPWCIQ